MERKDDSRNVGAVCSVCGRPLPNRFAVAGRCEGPDCRSPLCALHWRIGNRRCPEHGYAERKRDRSSETPGPEAGRESADKEGSMETPEKTPKKIDRARVKQAAQSTLAMVKRLGAGAGDLLRRLKKDKSPEAMLATIEESISANAGRRESVAARVERLHNEISAKKAEHGKAAPARRRIIEAELQSRLAEYKAAERELTVLLENERVLSQVKGRMLEVVSYGMAGVSEDQIDELVEEVEDAVEDAEGRMDAARDLDKAGKRRDRESDRESLWDELADFDVETPPAATEPEPREETAPAPERRVTEERPPKKAEPERE